MLNYFMSANGMVAVIGNCAGGGVRLSVIRICRANGWEIPPATLDETADIEELRALNVALLIRRAQRKAQQPNRAPEVSPEIAAEVADLRKQASRMRTMAQYADSSQAYAEDLAAAQRLEAQAAMIERSGATVIDAPPPLQPFDADVPW